MIDRLVLFILTLLVSTAPTETERAFSAVKHVKIVHHNETEGEFLANSMMIDIEQELVKNMDLDSIIDEFYFIKHQKVQLR